MLFACSGCGKASASIIQNGPVFSRAILQEVGIVGVGDTLCARVRVQPYATVISTLKKKGFLQ